jgi:hypothetical protein
MRKLLCLLLLLLLTTATAAVAADAAAVTATAAAGSITCMLVRTVYNKIYRASMLITTALSL